MAEGGISTQRWHAARWLRLEGLFSAALLVPWRGAPAICDAQEKWDEKRLARFCVTLARSNALLTAWQALALALVEPELREALADTGEIAMLDVVLGDTPALATWFEQSVRTAAATELRTMLDNTVALPAVQPASLLQWFDKPVARLASLAAEHLALQLEAQGMRALPFVLGVPSSPAFRELAGQSSAQLRRLSESLAEFPMRQLSPSLHNRWIADRYVEGRYVGRARSGVVARGDASGEEARGPIVERAIDEEWNTLADRQATPDDPPRVESPRPEPASALILRRLAHAGLSVFAGALAGFAAIAVFTPFAGRGDRGPESERDLEAERSAPAAVPFVSSAAAEPVAVVPPVAMVPKAPPAPTGTGVAEAPLGSATAAQTASPAQTTSPAVTPKTLNSKTCDVALVYVQRGEIAQAITRFESCPSPERELVRHRIGERGAVEVRAKAEKGQCDEAAAIVALVESIEAAGPAKAAFASRCDLRAREIESETPGP